MADELKADLNALADRLSDWMDNEPYSKPPYHYIWDAVEALRRLAAFEAGGMVMVPAVATKDMAIAAAAVIDLKSFEIPLGCIYSTADKHPAMMLAHKAYRAMLAARPQGGK